jgi:hypothetical protein
VLAQSFDHRAHRGREDLGLVEGRHHNGDTRGRHASRGSVKGSSVPAAIRVHSGP